ncbi:M48 family metallopeptidase [Roseovarius sp. LXJ103]|uniref:M48 family metallopeptidase n=1 Tax=Roseovarius carneus TaxID=2853164 RepID=UPI000D61F3B7|nr:SprT family zinc-dependent metalloprotease [Roseovarius carneus]MBZ8118034.1 M48 family metallopeptidase [Roseovarius carneus]PWE37322.1 M48 family peptidase [Pelagicola sp. LXJ1103]
MGQHILPGNPPIAITLRRSAQARRISLRVSALDGRVTLTLPPGLPEAEALSFARQKQAWLAGHLARQPDDVTIAPGASLPVEGETLELRTGSGRRVHREGGALYVPGPVAPRVQAWLKTLARERLVAASDHYSGVLGRPYSRITLRDTRSRWASCSSTGALNYSWRLIMAPPDVLDYVAAHEVAHLAEMNHSQAFWDIVARLCPGYDAHRLWLKTHGTALHRYRFGD